MEATLGIVVGLVFSAVAGIWIALPGKPFNGWLIKHAALEAMYPLIFMCLSLMSAVAFMWSLSL